jgi:hypothetical protein
MDRVLALQSLLDSLDIEIEPVPGNSNRSGVCSLQSSGAGRSSCSIACGPASEMDW